MENLRAKDVMIRLSSGYWNKNVNSNWGVTATIERIIRQLEIVSPSLLPDLRTAKTLIMTSDYGGQHKGSAYESFAFLITDAAQCGNWNEARKKIRQDFFRDERRMSYKGLNDGQRRSALVPFLSIADQVPGLLITVLVQKKFSEKHNLTEMERGEIPHYISTWPTHVIAKMTFVAHLGALFLAGLSSFRQNILWLTDNDDFVANDQRVTDMTPLFGGIIGQYAGHELGHFRFGTMKCDSGDLQIEDLAAIPDLVAGACCELPLDGTWRTQSKIRIPLRDHVSPKALTVLHWIGQSSNELKRLVLTVEIGDDSNKVKVRALDLAPE